MREVVRLGGTTRYARIIHAADEADASIRELVDVMDDNDLKNEAIAVRVSLRTLIGKWVEARAADGNG